MNQFKANCLPVEYLNTNDARDDSGTPMFVVTMRLGLDPLHPFKPTDLALSKPAVERLIQDLQRAVRSSTISRRS